MSKNDLKRKIKPIIKECIYEILSEGLFKENINQDLKNTFDDQNEIKTRKKENFSRKTKNKFFESKLDETVNKTTKDPVLAEILRDTAMTTLQEQIDADKSSYSNLAIDKVNNIDESFGEASNNWAHLAFFDSENKK